MTPLPSWERRKDINMGFGLTFIGYFFLIFFPLSRIDVLPNLAVLGCVVMIFGLKRLTYYCSDNRAFSVARLLGAILTVLSIVAIMLDIAAIDNLIEEELFPILAPVVNVLYALVITSFTGALFIGVYKLSGEVELPKLAKRSVFMLSANAAYLVAEIAASICSLVRTLGAPSGEVLTTITGYLGIIAFIFAYIILFLNLSLIFSCYARICLEGDEDMPCGTDIFDKLTARKKRKKK